MRRSEFMLGDVDFKDFKNFSDNGNGRSFNVNKIIRGSNWQV